MFEATVGRGALWAALSKTGNARYAPLLLALDVKGSNDLAAKAEAAIAGGMSQADIEAVLAFNTPAAPETVQGRKDHPTLIQASGKASLTLALAAAQPNQRRQALEALDNDMLAKSTKPAHESRLRTFMAICAAWEIQAFPLTPECIRCVGASFKAGCYRSAAVYFQTAVSHQLRVLGLPTSHFLRSMIRDVVRSVKRGLGPSQLKSGFDLAALSRVVDPHDDQAFNMERAAHMADLMILCSWFMLREIEISFSRDIHLTIAGSEVQLLVPVHKTNTHGALTVRSLMCACGIRDRPLCPWHAAERHLIRLSNHAHKGNKSYLPLFPDADGGAVSKYQFVKCLRTTLQLAGVETTMNDAHGRAVERYGGHSLRVAGAQFLAAAGIQTALIQLLGRWSSSAIERYVQTAPLSVVPQIPGEVLAAKAHRNSKQGVVSPGTPFAVAVPATPRTAPYDRPASSSRTSSTPGRLISDPADGLDSSMGIPEVAQELRSTAATQSAQIDVLRAELANLAKAIKPPDEVMVVRPHSSVVHKSLCDEIQTPPAQWRTRCGWRYGTSRFFRVGVMADTQRFCKKCFDVPEVDGEQSEDSGDESSSSSSSGSSSTPSS